MNFNILTSKKFDKELKRLSKKYPSLKNEYAQLIESLEDNPTQGISLAHSCYKIRISIASKGKGKSGGGRIITYVFVKDKTVYLLTYYLRQSRTGKRFRERDK